jgi:putative oxidoreductase
LFSAYPGGLAGIGLVLLRSVIGFTAAWQGILYLATKDTAAPVRVVGGLAVLTGILLVAGFRTRLAGFIIALGVAFISLCTFPVPTRDLLNPLLTVFAETVSIAVAFLGPGAFSIDAYLYGRKEIIIPYRSRE